MDRLSDEHYPAWVLCFGRNTLSVSPVEPREIQLRYFLLGQAAALHPLWT